MLSSHKRLQVVVLAVGLVALFQLACGSVPRNTTGQLHGERHECAIACYGELGCYDTKDFFHPVYRPISLLPESREEINTRFGLHTRKNPPTEVEPEPQFIAAHDKESVDKSFFNKEKPIKFLVHGFLNTGFLEWVNELGNALLEIEDYNMITVDWSGGNGLPYTQAAANTWIVGGEIAILCKFFIEEYGVKPEKIHIIGHSLGAHIAGYAGDRLDGDIGRISGLDPAEPLFQYMSEHIRLDSGDAKFVDVIHTDGKTILLLGFGMVQPVGHLDFYPNGGSAQPGCDMEGSITSLFEDGLEGMQEFVACNHQRAIDVYTESVTSKCPFIAHECYAYEYYQKGRCLSCGEDGSKCARMGYHSYQHADPSGIVNKKLYLTTSSEEDYCVYHYVVTVVMDQTTNQEEEEGFLKATLFGESSKDHITVLNPNSMTLRRGRRYPFLVSSHESLGVVHRVDFSWKQDTGFFGDWFWFWSHKGKLYIKSIEVEPIDTLPETKRVAESTVTCMNEEEAILPMNIYTFYTSDNCKKTS